MLRYQITLRSCYPSQTSRLWRLLASWFLLNSFWIGLSWNGHQKCSVVQSYNPLMHIEYNTYVHIYMIYAYSIYKSQAIQITHRTLPYWSPVISLQPKHCMDCTELMGPHLWDAHPRVEMIDQDRCYRLIGANKWVDTKPWLVLSGCPANVEKRIRSH